MIRRASGEEADTLAALFRRAYGTLTFLPLLHTPEEDRAHIASVLAEREVWVFEDAGEIVGFAAFTDGLLTDLYVEPDRRRGGIGSALLEHAKSRRPTGSSSGCSRRTSLREASTRRAAAAWFASPTAPGTRNASRTRAYAWP
ncbi:MAG: GNAT family N-acetyltransferase [Actinobacteria bacterium]|nr:GNAT family N-acetyltransferase [Actinomycetota bacterium]